MSAPPRLHATTLPAPGVLHALDPATARHARVLRLGPDDAVVLFDGAGREVAARVVAVDADGVMVAAEGPPVDADDAVRLVLVQALPKGAKLDGVVRMATEIGAAAIHLVTTARTVSRPEAARAEARLERLARIAQEAARQARRARVPEVHAPAPLLEAARRAPPDAARVLFWEEASAPLPLAPIDAAEVWTVIGPEGGLEAEEVLALEALGFRTHRMGRSVLRVETAAPVALALLADRAARRPHA